MAAYSAMMAPAPRPPSGKPRGRSRQSGSQSARGDKSSSALLRQELCDDSSLREENDDLRARCEWQAQALRELRLRIEELQGGASSASPLPPPSIPGMPRPATKTSALRLAPVANRSCEQGTQTDADDQVDTHEQQLDEAHKKAGQKTRELWLAEQRAASLQKQLKRTEDMVSQYKEEIDNLEEQLRIAKERQHRAEDERSFTQRTYQHAWAENEKASCSEGSTRAPSVQSVMHSPLASSGGFCRPLSANITSRPSTCHGSQQSDIGSSSRRCSSRQAMAFEASSSSEDEDPRCEPHSAFSSAMVLQRAKT